MCLQTTISFIGTPKKFDQSIWKLVEGLNGGVANTVHGFFFLDVSRLTPLRPSTNNTVIWTKTIHDTRLIFSLFHDTRLIFWMFHATRLTPLRPS